MKVYYVTHVLKKGIKIETMYPNYQLEFRNTKSQVRITHFKGCELAQC